MTWLRNCVAAFRFLTIFPWPGVYGSRGEDLRGALPWFPLVGLVLGGVAAAGAWLAWRHLLPPVAAVILTLLLLCFSGAMHLDGLADTADGFFSARGRQEMLVIMRDSRIGVMGVAAVVLVLLLKTACLQTLALTEAVRAAFLIPLAGRCALVLMVALLPYVRPEGGLATTLYAKRTPLTALMALTVLAAAGYLVRGWPGLAAGAVSALAVWLFSRQSRRKIGGATGDTLGAACEIAECVMVLVLAAH